MLIAIDQKSKARELDNPLKRLQLLNNTNKRIYLYIREFHQNMDYELKFNH